MAKIVEEGKILAKASEQPYNINELTECLTIGSTKFLDQTATRTFYAI